MADKTGLFLGKFAPLHKGHQLVIETALREVDNLVIIAYDCRETDVPLKTRIGWLKALYPQAEVVEAWGGPEEVGYTPEIKKKQEDYVLKLLNGRKIDCFFSSEPYGEHMSLALNAENRQIDLKRGKIPISGTELRRNLFRNRQFVDPLVYKSLVKNVVFLGGPSTGKSTLAEELAKRFSTEFMPEYGREYWDKHQVGRRLTLKQLVEIARGHIEREDRLLENANKYLFTDTNAITTYLFSLYYHGKADPELENLAEKCVSRYNQVFVCDVDIPYDNTWDRSGGANREHMQKLTLDFLKEHKIPFTLISGTLEERIKKVASALGEN